MPFSPLPHRQAAVALRRTDMNDVSVLFLKGRSAVQFVDDLGQMPSAQPYFRQLPGVQAGHEPLRRPHGIVQIQQNMTHFFPAVSSGKNSVVMQYLAVFGIESRHTHMKLHDKGVGLHFRQAIGLA